MFQLFPKSYGMDQPKNTISILDISVESLHNQDKNFIRFSILSTNWSVLCRKFYRHNPIDIRKITFERQAFINVCLAVSQIDESLSTITRARLLFCCSTGSFRCSLCDIFLSKFLESNFLGKTCRKITFTALLIQ